MELTNIPMSVKKRGRPKGSTNKPKVSGEELLKLSLPKITLEPKDTKIIKKEDRIPAIEYEFKPETKEEKERTVEQLKEVKWWETICACTHSRTAHKTIGTGACMITGCTCKEYE